MIAIYNSDLNKEEDKSRENQPELISDIISEQDYSNENKIVEENEEATEKDSRNRNVFIAVAILILIGVLFILTNNKDNITRPISKVFNNKDKKSAEQTAPVSTSATSWQTADGAYALEIEDQNAGNLIKIKSFNFAKDGWLVIYTDENNAPKYIVSAYRFSQGSAEYWDMPLIKDLDSNTKYHAVIFDEDGDKQFNHLKDSRVLDENGEEMSVSFMTK